MKITWLGRAVHYEAGLEAQYAARDRVLAGGEDELLLLEHSPTVTLGRRGGLVDRDALARLNTPVFETKRGGLATWHGPGQLVGYPIIDTKRAKVGVRVFVCRLGELMRTLAAELGVDDLHYDPDRPGVYRDGRKVGSIGLHLHKGVTTHGFALNVDVDFAGFRAIDPCGFADLVVSSLVREGATLATMDAARSRATQLAPGLLLTAVDR
ncbi:MAG: lipoyl(octanoyl) transferase [Myxococcota bacterium]|jgi:lipoyl(octanoyl) transferase